MFADNVWLRRVFVVAGFIFFVVFFLNSYPLIPMDADDWLYLSVGRHVLPLWGYWNPTKVFPEVLMPTCGEFAAEVVLPVIGDYIDALKWTFALILSFFIMMYAYMMQRLFSDKYGLTEYWSIWVTVLVLILHFLIFRSQLANNDYLFYSTDVTCCFNYTIPFLLNASIVLYLMRKGGLSVGLHQDRIRVSLLVIALYFALFSNLFSSVVLAAYVGVATFVNIVLAYRKESLKNIIVNNGCGLFFIGCWTLVHLFELSGGRAGNIDEEGAGLGASIDLAISELGNKLTSLNHTFSLLLFACFSFVVFLWRRLSDNDKKDFIVHCGTGSIVFCYLIILSANSVPHYIWRPEVLLSGCLYIFLIIAEVLALAIKEYNRISSFIPLLIIILGGEAVYTSDTHGRAYRDRFGLNPIVGEIITKDLVNQYITDEFKGNASIVIEMPKIAGKSKYPATQNSIELMGGTLYKHGLINCIPCSVIYYEGNDQD